jgi:hypothetical protein
VKGYPALRRGLLPSPLVIEQLEVAGSALERGEAAGATTSPLDAAAPVERRGDCRRADEAAEEERPETPALVLAVHALILEVSPGRAPVETWMLEASRQGRRSVRIEADTGATEDEASLASSAAYRHGCSSRSDFIWLCEWLSALSAI